ncbi:MAG: iron chelate uptake ABC transporter family permease subunit [Candidatus Latescibacterota bacterium]|jgi:iron complex transport system permease protein
MNRGRTAPLSLVILLLGAVLVAACLLALGVGPAGVPPRGVLRALGLGTGVGDPVETAIVLNIRLPRVLLAVLVGAALAQSGAVMQGFFRNPMADPYLIGVSAGAALGASLAVFLSLDFWFLGVNGISACAFAGAILVTFTVYAISVRGGRLPVSLVLLTGVAVSSLASAVTSYLVIASGEDLHRLLFWLMGSLSSRRWEHLQMAWPQVLVGLVVVQFYARDLNLILQGEENAKHLGVEVERVKRVLLVAAALLAAAAVAVSGIVGFVGLVVPHVMRLIVGPDHRRLFPASLLGGAALLVLADTLARVVIAPAELPIGIVTALLGAPFFLFLLSRRGQVLP